MKRSPIQQMNQNTLNLPKLIKGDKTYETI
jgi:hypothetical protein